MQWLAPMLRPLGEWGVLVLILHPVWLTLLVALLSVILIVRLQLWRKHRRACIAVLVGAGAVYLLDAAIALPRIAYAWRIPEYPVAYRKVQLPAMLVLVNADCDKECHARLISGELKEVILVETHIHRYAGVQPPRRYRAGWSLPRECPPERLRALHWSVAQLGKDGFCPLIEPTGLPAVGIFVVQESFLVIARERAARFRPTYLTDAPPGLTIRFRAVEVQLRSPQGVEVIAARRKYEAPGLLGLPPLIGCWERPDNIIWIMPPGDTGCGLWRWFTWGGDQGWSDDTVEWVYRDVFTAPAE